MPEVDLGAEAVAAADFKEKFWCLIVNGSRIIQNPRRSDYARILDTGHLLLSTENFLLKIRWGVRNVYVKVCLKSALRA